MLFKGKTKNLNNVLELDNVKSVARYLIIHCLNDGQVVPLPTYNVTLINMCTRLGAGVLMSNYEEVNTSNTYYGTVKGLFSIPEGLFNLPINNVKQYFNPNSFIYFNDYNDATRYTNYVKNSNNGKEITKTNTRYIEVKYSDTMAINLRSSDRVSLPRPEFYTDEHEIITTGELSEFKTDILNVNQSKPLYENVNCLYSLDQLKDSNTELLFANIADDVGPIGTTYEYTKLAEFTISAYGILKTSTTRSLISSVIITLDTDSEMGLYEDIKSNFDMPKDANYTNNFWIKFLSTLKYMNDLFKNNFDNCRMFIYLDNITLRSKLIYKLENNKVDDIVMNKTSHEFSMMVNIDGTI